MINIKANINTPNELPDVENFVEINPAKVNEGDPILGPEKTNRNFAGSPDFQTKGIEDQLKEGLIISFGVDFDNDQYVQLIKDISEKLFQIGYLKTKISEFNEDLKDAIKVFQKANSLNVTAVIDYELYLKLIKNKDVVVKKDYHEKKTDAAAAGEIYALPKKDEDWRGVFFEEKEEIIVDISDEPIDDAPEDIAEEDIEEDSQSNNNFDVQKVSASSGVSAAMIMAFIKGESGGDPNAKAFNGDNYCKCLGWGSSSDTERFMQGLEAGNITGSSYINKKWVKKTRFGFKKDYSDWKANKESYKKQSYYYRSGYLYWDTAYFSAHKEGSNSQKAFDLAYSINPRCAIEATAWGMAQVMGSHLINSHKEMLDMESGKAAREHFDDISLLASSDMYVSWVKSAGRFSSKSKANISYANRYNVPEVLGATYLDVIGMAEKDSSKYGYFLFLTRKVLRNI